MKKIILLSLMVWLFSLNFVHAQLPSVNLKTMDGQSINTDTLSNDGKPFIIDFFATWCKPCNRELDAIAEVYEDWQKETGVKIVAVSIDQAQNINKVTDIGTGIRDLNAAADRVVKTEYFDLSGRKVLLPSNGVYIQSQQLKNGETVTRKVVFK